jgi:hypothetical protein
MRLYSSRPTNNCPNTLITVKMKQAEGFFSAHLGKLSKKLLAATETHPRPPAEAQGGITA